MVNSEVVFPIFVTFEDGSVEEYESVQDLELNLEDFDSDVALECRVVDGLGRPVQLKLKLLELQKLSIIRES